MRLLSTCLQFKINTRRSFWSWSVQTQYVCQYHTMDTSSSGVSSCAETRQQVRFIRTNVYAVWQFSALWLSRNVFQVCRRAQKSIACDGDLPIFYPPYLTPKVDTSSSSQACGSRCVFCRHQPPWPVRSKQQNGKRIVSSTS